MSWEWLIWVGMGIILAEIVFYYFLKYNGTEDWGAKKFAAYLFTAGFLSIQFCLISDIGVLAYWNYNYGALLFELIFAIILIIIIYSNKQLVKHMKKKELANETKIKKKGLKKRK